jgi:putative endonuclease
MIQNETNDLYVGVSEDPQKRVLLHNARLGSVFTRTGTFKIVFLEEYQTLAEARHREIQIKKWRREKKDLLIDMFLNNLPTKLN